MADQIITITIPDAYVASTVQGVLEIKPNIETLADGITLKYTTKQWVTEVTRRYLKLLRRRGLQEISDEANIVVDDDEAVIGT